MCIRDSYMHDLSSIGLDVHDFLHEGNGEVWKAALEYGPRAYVHWVAIEETAEGGDALYQRSKTNPRFLEGFSRVAEGGGVALYRAVVTESGVRKSGSPSFRTSGLPAF